MNFVIKYILHISLFIEKLYLYINKKIMPFNNKIKS